MGTTEGGQGRVLGASGSPAAGDRALFSRSPKVSVRCIGLVFTEDKRGARGSPWGVAWWGRGPKLEEGGVREGQGLRRGRDSVRLYIIYRDIESVHACLAPGAHPRAALVHCPPPQGCLLVNLDSIQTTILGCEWGEEDVLIAVNRGREPRAMPPPPHLVPSPFSAPGRQGWGCLPRFDLLVYLRGRSGRAQGIRERYQGAGSPERCPYGPQFGTKHYQSHEAPGTCGCPTKRPTGGRGRGPHCRAGAGLPAERPKAPYSGPACPISPPGRGGAELGGPECQEEEGDAHRQGQALPLGAGPADALLQLRHLGILSLKVFCGDMRRHTGEGRAARQAGARGSGSSGGAGT